MGDLSMKPAGTGFKRAVVNLFYEQTMLIILILLVIVMTIASNSFLSLGNLFNVVRQFSVHGILACGMTIVIIGKGMDLSAASILALCAVANVLLQPYGYAVSIAGSLAVGVACGLLNGYLIARVKARQAERAPLIAVIARQAHARAVEVAAWTLAREWAPRSSSPGSPSSSPVDGT